MVNAHPVQPQSDVGSAKLQSANVLNRLADMFLESGEQLPTKELIVKENAADIDGVLMLCAFGVLRGQIESRNALYCKWK